MFSTCYCANAALLRVQELPAETRIVSVLSRDYAMDYREVITSNLELMRGARIDEVILIGAFMLQPISKSLRGVVGGAPIRKRLSFQRTRAVIRIIGWRRAWRLMRARTSAFGVLARLLSKHEHMGVKPSTGLYSVVLAFDQRPDAEIHVSGIGLAPDGIFTESGSKGRAHIEIDRSLIEPLEKSGRVFFHDI